MIKTPFISLLLLSFLLHTTTTYAFPVSSIPDQQQEYDQDHLITDQQEYRWPILISQPLINLLGQECYVTLAEEFHITDINCMKLAISKALGLGIVVGGAIVKIPQIITVVRHKSAQGLSLASFLLETSAYLIVLVYNTRLGNPFSTFGEVLFMSIQNILISLMIVHYNKQGKTRIVLICTGYTIGFVTLSAIPNWLMSLLYAVQIPIGLASKLPQIITNYKNKSTGQLSVFAVLNYFVGTTARAFTTWAELDDKIMLFGNLLASLLNGFLVLQVIMYWGQKNRGSLLDIPLFTTAAKAE
jgi:mannose-P-dolichol utilization defect protein 1